MVLFPEIDRVKTFLSLTACIVECVSEYIFLIKKNRQRKQEDQKKKKKKSKEAIVNIVCELDRVANFSCFSYEFNVNVVYVQWEKSRYFLYSNNSNIWSTHFQKQKLKKTIIKRHSCLSFYRLYLFIEGRKFVIIETCAYDVAHDKNALSSLIIQTI